MLLPQVEERDVCYYGNQVDDINTLVEYIQQEVLDMPDDTPEDEDDDKGQDFWAARSGNDLYEQKIKLIQVNAPEKENVNVYFDNKPEKTSVINFDTLTPPPKA